MKSLATADDVMPYTPNNDTLYSGALLELGGRPSHPDRARHPRPLLVGRGRRLLHGEPLLHRHARNGRQGRPPCPRGAELERQAARRCHRTSGSLRQRHVRSSYRGSSRRRIRSGEVRELQSEFALTSLSNWGDKALFGRAHVPELRERPHHDGELSFFETLANLLVENPPSAAHAAAVALLGRGGIVIGRPFRPESFDEPTPRGAARAESDGPEVMRWKVKQRGTPYPSRWNNLRPGTYGVDYLDRAAGALEGLFVHDRDEAVYFSTYEDGDGELLDGRRAPEDTGERLVVHHDVWGELSAREERDWPIFARRSESLPAIQRRRLARHPCPERGAERP